MPQFDRNQCQFDSALARPASRVLARNSEGEYVIRPRNVGDREIAKRIIVDNSRSGKRKIQDTDEPPADDGRFRAAAEPVHKIHNEDERDRLAREERKA